jgi:hypothetical protein
MQQCVIESLKTIKSFGYRASLTRSIAPTLERAELNRAP